MAEAIAGLSLAANILQMVEYGGFFVKTALNMYSTQADTKAVKDFKLLRHIAGDMNKVLGSLEKDAHEYPPTSMHPQDGQPELAALMEECRKVTAEILDFVGKADDQTSRKSRLRKAVKEASQLTWGQDKLNKLQTQLDSMRSQVMLRLLLSLRHYAAASSETQELALRRITEGMQHLNYKIDQALDSGLCNASVDLISRRIAVNRAGRQSADTREYIRHSLKSDLLRAMSESGQDAEPIELGMFNISPSRGQTLKRKLLKNLSYPDMFVRETSVVTASETTFRWIFEREKRPDRPWASFCEWLEAPDEQLYWIIGKPGSGKSTLMKFISQPADDGPETQPGKPANRPRCSSFLQGWAGTHPLIITSYYFWAIGSPLQRSKEGMLRTLLHGLLSQVDPEVIATIMPESWEALHLLGEDSWPCTGSSLQDRLSRAFEHMCCSMKICLFIDGLDEFDGQHEGLIRYLRQALATHPIKLCVSSRQWQVFEDEFQKEPGLRLQDLTLPDMMGYVRSQLYNEPAFALLRNLNPTFSDSLDETIALRADGVFLWLNLVVKSFQKGIRAGDRTSDLQIRLDHLPPDLEALFDRILGELDPEFLDHAIQYFELMEARRDIGPPNVMVFSYADEENEEFGIDCPVLPLDMSTYENRRDQLKRRLNSRCMGLLEITERQSPFRGGVFFDASNSRVNYLHRTVGDYIARDEVRERLVRKAGRGLPQGYDPHLHFCSSELAFCKSDPDLARSHYVHESSLYPSDITQTSLNCLRHAAKVQGPRTQSMIRLVDELRNVTQADYGGECTLLQSKDVYEFKSFDALRGRVNIQPPIGYEGAPFTPLVIECGVVEYIRAKSQQPSQTKKLWRKMSAPVIKHTNHFSTHAADEWKDLDRQLNHAVLSSSPSPAIVEILLERGADPMYIAPKERVSNWILSLMVYIYVCHEGLNDKKKREEIIALMVKYGAPIERKAIMKACEKVIVPSKIPDREGTLMSYVEEKLKIMKQELT